MLTVVAVLQVKSQGIMNILFLKNKGRRYLQPI